MKRKILLSFDIEEFDTPLDYGFKIEEPEQFRVSAAGTKAILDLMDEMQVRATFFTTANFALNHGELMRRMLDSGHEVASHGYFHTTFEIADLKKSKDALENLLGEPITGYRMARMAKLDDAEVKKAGYSYNSSLNPTYLPGKYNNFFKKRTVFFSHGLIQIPASVMPWIRFPLFWLSFHNLPLAFLKPASLITLKKDNYLNLYFHPWEFQDVSNYGMPKFVSRISGEGMIDKLRKYIVWVKKYGEFITFKDFCNEPEVKKLSVAE